MTVVYRDGSRHRRFLVVGVYQIVLVEPDATRLGWGVSTFVGCLQDLEVRNLSSRKCFWTSHSMSK